MAGISSPFVAFALSLLPLLIPGALLDLRKERRSLLAADSAYAASASHGLLPAFGDMLDENVIFLDPGARLLFGKAANLERLSADPASAAATETWRAVRVDVSADGRAGYTYGFGSVNGPFGSGGVLRTLATKYIAYWRRDRRNAWRVAAYVRVFQPVTAPADPPTGFESPDATYRRSFPNTDPERHLFELMDADRAFAARALSHGARDAFAVFAAPDGAMLSGQPGIVYGRDGIREHLAANFPATGRIVWQPVAGHVAASGDLGFTVGEAEIYTAAPDGTRRASYTKYLTIWRRLDRGEWRYEIDGGNERPER